MQRLYSVYGVKVTWVWGETKTGKISDERKDNVFIESVVRKFNAFYNCS